MKITRTNGFGKTGIFRAIMFVLYGDRCLKQDSLTKEQEREGLILVNEKLLEQNKNEKVKAIVSIDFEDNNKSYALTRNIIAQKTKMEHVMYCFLIMNNVVKIKKIS